MATDFGHTKGPWRITSVMLGHAGDVYVPTAKQITDCHHVARCFAPKPEKAPLCDLQTLQMTKDAVQQIEANARLIAAAPELLEALTGLEGILATAESNASGNPEWESVSAKINAARSAIAKATGK